MKHETWLNDDTRTADLQFDNYIFHTTLKL